MVEETEAQHLEKKLRKKDINIWRLADSDEWATMRDKSLLSFNWLDPEINYSEIDLDDLDRGKWSIRPWVKELSVGDIIFVMNKNSYCGIAKAKSAYSHDGPHVAIGTTKIKPAIEVEYLHEVEEPVPHNISTHNNPRTFADIDKYNFGLDNVLAFLQQEIPEAIKALEKFIVTDQGSKTEGVAQKLLDSIEILFPDFKGFTDPRFIEREITYKQRIIRDAQEQFSKNSMRQLLQEENYEEIYERVLKIGRHKDNNLLYKGTPKTGDLALLHDEDLELKAFAEPITHLVQHHWDESGKEKVDLFCDWAEGQGLPNKWTFVTYYMFVTNPEEELFVKPKEMKAFLEMLDKGDLWHHRPTGEMYQTIKDDLRTVGDALPFEVKRGFLDLQSFLWTAIAAEDKKESKSLFTWVPVHKKLANKLVDYEDKQQELIEILKEVGISGFTDRADEGETELDAMDGFTFFRYIHKHGDENRLKYLLKIAEKFGISTLATDVTGLPTANPTTARLFPFKRERKDEVAKLWGYFKTLVSDDFSASEWEKMKNLPGIAIPTLTHVLFYVKPDEYLPIDQHMKPYLEQVLNIDAEIDSYEDYKILLANVREVSDQHFYEISKEAFDWHTGDVSYWWLNANPDIWRFSEKEVGQEQWYTSHNKNGNKRRIYQHFQEVEPGDLIIGYESTPVKRVKAILEVTEALYTDDEDKEKFTFQLKEFTPNQPSWESLKSIPELENCSVLNNNQGSLFQLSEDEFLMIRDLAMNGVQQFESYGMTEALDEVFMKEYELQNILDLLEYKKNIILQGPPGTGKTFLAKRLAWLKSGVKDPNRIEVVQFHQSYSYEDFIRGYRPTEEHFELKDGIFMQMCKRAKSDPENKPYFLVIDEINRGNLSKIFGELMMLIENDKRGPEFTVKLPYRKDEDEPDFYIPKNLHLIGTMNTADRSLAMVDYALRRRFVFIDMMPNFAKKFQMHLKEQGVEDHLIDTIVERLNELNKKIADKQELGPGPGYQIGHSYFCGTEDGDEDWYKNIIRYEIIPLLNEYWFDKPTKVEEVEEQLLTI